MIKRLRHLVGGIIALAAVLAASATGASAQTTADIAKKGSVTIGVLTGIPPYDTVDANGNTDGFIVDLAKEAAAALGVKLEIVPVNNASRAAALESGRVDFLIAQMTATPERAKTFLMTNPYGAYEMRFVAAKDMKLTSLDDLKGKRVSVPKGSTQDVAVSGYGVEGLEVVRFDDDALAMQALISGQVDATAAVAAVANDIITKRNLSNLEVKKDVPLFTLYWSMATRKDATELHQWLNNFIYYIEVTGKLDQLHRKWIGIPVPGGKLPTF
ncbi:amino acid ABC transporter substrate-binding protein, PAAT family [Phyllobacterium sp. YR620]|jgi:polar amino acid transport system substrate-binding protein|uniref:Transporter substrate-binding domain-containing protein n=1 Tax=Phyllobacterium pellucidum TaxID=2740464 RepID=A0A849VVX9_9HYPH|nr:MULTISPECIES: transporter substrate-binding domain-containing protein [Phyllobacterium]NTS32994.1 transporter substrate-binding domain-containing protein [Phyllobacterium pellucidum]UGY11645.1 transporter substrate-binding domain-containing protein [Phyllobacterium sp. T1018]SDP27720.1 amino acid ABC transporter substrate-binding protein, PAAT family [Phyllobacterium sp. YR620]SFJ25215.1 amino acid ABC transporter substrate-binding protein, PAAT family [Phyllobacterium sp. CL33Tsu]